MAGRRFRWGFAVGLVLLAAALGVGVFVPLTVSGGVHGNAPLPPGDGASTRGTSHATMPIYAYFYQWYSTSSWDRAKADYPLAGRYSSDDTAVIRTQVRQARAAGIDGFLTSWKDTPQLDRRLDRLIRVARRWHFDLGVVYEALDFDRRPLPIATVAKDMTMLVRTRARQLTSAYYGRPVIIWTGTDEYTRADVQYVRDALGGRALLLAASKQPAGYERIADLVDGEAYYWSSADPASPSAAAKLAQMGAAVHAHGGIWIAPATSGFDGRTLAHTRVIPRAGGDTLRRSLADAFASRPDGVGVISWNEWSENTYIEPGQRYGDEEIRALTGYLSAHKVVLPTRSARSGSPGLRAALLLSAGSVLAAVVIWLVLARKSRVYIDASGRHRFEPAPSGDKYANRVSKVGV